MTTFATLVTPLLAQSNVPEKNNRTVIRYRVKPDRQAEFRAVVQEMQELRKKAGSERYVTWWTSQSGPLEYVSVRMYAKWAELDTAQDPKMREVAGQLAGLSSRMLSCVESMERTLDVLLPDLSLPRAAEMPAYVSSIRTLVKPGMAEAFMALYKSDILPAAKKAGLKTYLVSRTQFGGSRTEFRSIRGLSGLADLDSQAPIVAAMGPEAYQKFQAKLAPLIEGSEYQLYRFQPNMSYVPPR